LELSLDLYFSNCMDIVGNHHVVETAIGLVIGLKKARIVISAIIIL